MRFLYIAAMIAAGIMSIHDQAIARKYSKSDILVKFKPGVMHKTSDKIIGRLGGLRREHIGKSGFVRIKKKDAESIEEFLEKYRKNPDVEIAEPNYLTRAASVPNDTHYGQLWGLKNSGQTISSESYSTHNPGTSGKDLDIERVWSLRTDCSPITVAVLDTGVRYDHDDLSDMMWDGSGSGYPNHGYDYVDTDNNPMDENGHGTHVAATIGAEGNNGTGTTGVCWNSTIMAVRVLDSDGNGTIADLVSGISFAVANDAKILNISLTTSSYSEALASEITNAKSNGVLVVTAAGNSGVNLDSSGNAEYPCSFNHANILCVAALDQSYSIASFSNYGTTSVDIGAPGTNIKSAWYGNATIVSDDFSTGWITSGDWGSQNLNLGTIYPAMTNPSSWNDSTNYASNSNDWAYRNFGSAAATSTAEKVSMTFYEDHNIESGNDSLQIRYQAAAGQPTAGTLLDTLDGSSGTSFSYKSYSLTGCAGQADCTIGFNLQSNASVEDNGFAMVILNIEATDTDSTSGYYLSNGTSMASPHAAGLAALIWSANQSFTYADVIETLKAGGEAVSALDGKTKSGMAINAWNAYTYLPTPTGISISLK